MRYTLEDLLEEADLTALTGEALEEPVKKQKRWSWRRVGAIAACAVVVLGVLNYSALAAGVERAVQYLAGLGAVEEQVGLLVLEEPLEWTEGDWSYRLRAIQDGEYVSIKMDLYSCEEDPNREELSFPTEVESGKPFSYGGFAWQFTDIPVRGDYCWRVVYNMQLLANGEPQRRGVLDIDQWMDAEIHERVYDVQIEENDNAIGYVSPVEEGDILPGIEEGKHIRYEGSIQVMYKVSEQPKEGYTLYIRDWANRDLWELQLSMSTPEKLEYTEDTHTFPQGEVTALVSRDGRQFSFYVDRTLAVNTGEGNLWDVRADSAWFIGVSGRRYPARQTYGNTAASYMLNEYRAPESMEEPAVSIEIGDLTLETMLVHKAISDTGEVQWTRGYTNTYPYSDVNWVIDIP